MSGANPNWNLKMETRYWNLGWNQSISREAGRKPKTRTWEMKSERTWFKLELKQETRKRELESRLEPGNRTRDRLETRNRKLRSARSKSKPESEIGNQKPESRLEQSNRTRGQRATGNQKLISERSRSKPESATRIWSEAGQSHERLAGIRKPDSQKRAL